MTTEQVATASPDHTLAPEDVAALYHAMINGIHAGCVSLLLIESESNDPQGCVRDPLVDSVMKMAATLGVIMPLLPATKWGWGSKLASQI